MSEHIRGNTPGQPAGPPCARRFAYRLDAPAVLAGVGDYIDALSVADLKAQVEAASRLHGLGLLVVLRHDLAGELVA